MIAAAAITRGDVANYVDAIFLVYIVLLFVHLLLGMLFSFGLRVPYARWSDLVLGFLRDVSEPWLRVFRRFVPTLGGIDLSPLLAIVVLYVLRTIIVSLING